MTHVPTPLVTAANRGELVGSQHEALRLVEASDVLTLRRDDDPALAVPRDKRDAVTYEGHAALRSSLSAGPYVDVGRLFPLSDEPT